MNKISVGEYEVDQKEAMETPLQYIILDYGNDARCPKRSSNHPIYPWLTRMAFPPVAGTKPIAMRHLIKSITLDPPQKLARPPILVQFTRLCTRRIELAAGSRAGRGYVNAAQWCW